LLKTGQRRVFFLGIKSPPGAVFTPRVKRTPVEGRRGGGIEALDEHVDPGDEDEEQQDEADLEPGLPDGLFSNQNLNLCKFWSAFNW
jgi:hypothetical protein